MWPYASCVVNLAQKVEKMKMYLQKDGFTDWKHAAGKNGILQGHAGCHSHVMAMQSWNQFKKGKRLNTRIA